MRAALRSACGLTLLALLLSSASATSERQEQQLQPLEKQVPCTYSYETVASGIAYEVSLDVPITDCPWAGEHGVQNADKSLRSRCVLRGTASSLDKIRCITDQCKQVGDMVGRLISKFIQKHLRKSPKDAEELRLEYYKKYGLVIEGLVRHHKVDPLMFNSQVDDALPLDGIIRPDPKLRRLLESIDRRNVKLWLLSNAYVNHAKRVVKLLGVDDLFEGITYCDYGGKKPIACKPHASMYERAMREADVASTEHCYFVDDSAKNVKGAETFGWNAVHLVEPTQLAPVPPAARYRIRALEELRQIFPQFFRSEIITEPKAIS